MSERLWAPWRGKYVAAGESAGGCIFCDKPRQSSDDANGIVKRGATGFVIMNAYPYNSGHLMIVPYRHVADMRDLDGEELLEWVELTRSSISALEKAYRPDGINLGANLGRAAGAGIADHIHLHLVPRWNGDTNFMPAIADVKVLPESLEESANRLRAAFDAIDDGDASSDRGGRSRSGDKP